MPLNIFGQELTGTWIGREGGASYLKLVIVQIGDSCFGYTYDEGPGFCKTNFAGRFDKQTQKLKGKGVSFIERSPDHVLAAYNLTYLKDGEKEYLHGNVAAKGAVAFLLSLGMPSFAELTKIITGVDTTRFMWDRIIFFENKYKVPDTQQSIVHNDAMVDTNKITRLDTTLQVKQGRVSKMVQTIFTNADTIKMMLYDNGVVDNDTVTIFFDNAVILDRYRITEKARELYIPLTKNGRSHTVELFANNLGTIPPNTALIIIMAGNDRYEVHASYDLSTNATIIFQYKD
ncbi:MAG: hypothetical protein ABI707_07895 [Ferruginibacter sp.]